METRLAAKKSAMFCMAVTPMDEEGRLDELGIRLHLRRMVRAGVGVYVGSGGTGEGASLEPEELALMYRIGVEECKGRVPVHANLREAHTAAQMLRTVRLAIAAGVDLVQLYQVQSGHGHQPNSVEQEGYFRELLDQIDHPVSISMHMASGYLGSPELPVRLCKEYPQIKGIHAGLGTDLSYFVRLRDGIRSEVIITVGISQLLGALPLGAGGCLALEPNIAPKLCRSVIDCYLAGNVSEAAVNYAHVMRLNHAIQQPPPSNAAKTVKTALKALGLPGGPVRKPYRLPDDNVVAQVRSKLEATHIQELEELASVRQ